MDRFARPEGPTVCSREGRVHPGVVSRGSGALLSPGRSPKGEPGDTGRQTRKAPSGAPWSQTLAHTFASMMAHGVFSTKHRRPLLSAEILPDLVRVVGGIIRDRDGRLLALNGTADHIHLLAIFHPKYAVSDMFRDIKAISSDWIHRKHHHLRDFAWKSGYGVFSVSQSI